MGVPEATVRKRIERGLALLRERLDREFGSKSNAWAIALLEPGLRTAVLKGVGIMSLKWIAAAGAVALLAGVAWYARGSSASGEGEAVGGTGVVVPLDIAAAREKPALPDATRLENAEEAQRTAAGTTPAPAATAPSIHGFLFVDDEHRAPQDLSMVAKLNTGSKLHFDTALATWCP